MRDNIQFLVGEPANTGRRLAEILSEQGKKCENLEVRTYYGQELDLKTLYDEISNPSLFSPDRIVIIKQMETIEKKTWDEMLPMLEKHSGENILVVFEGFSAKVRIPGKNSWNGKEDSDEQEIFKKIGSVGITARDLHETVVPYIEKNHYGFMVVISAMEMHVRKAFLERKISEKQFVERLRRLQDLDLKLKSGRISYAPGWETLLIGLICSGR